MVFSGNQWQILGTIRKYYFKRIHSRMSPEKYPLRLRLRQCLFNQNRYRYHIRFTKNITIYNNHILLIYNESNACWETSIKVTSDRWHGGHPKRNSMLRIASLWNLVNCVNCVMIIANKALKYVYSCVCVVRVLYVLYYEMHICFGPKRSINCYYCY